MIILVFSTLAQTLESLTQVNSLNDYVNNVLNFKINLSVSLFFMLLDQIWLLGRDKDFAVEIRTKIYDILTKLGLDSERLVLAKNSNCPSLL